MEPQSVKDWLSLVFSLIPRRKKVTIAGLTIARVAVAFLDVLALVLVGVVTSSLLSPNSSDQAVSIEIPILGAVKMGLLAASVATVALFLVRTLASTFLQLATARTLAELESQKATQIAEKLFESNYEEFSKYRVSEINWALISSPHAMFPGLIGTIVSLFADISLFAVVAVLFLALDPAIAGILSIYFLLVALVYRHLVSRKIVAAAKNYADGTVGAVSAFNAMVSVNKESRVFGVSGFFVDGFTSSRRKLSNAAASQNVLAAIPRQLIEASLIVGFMSLVVWFLLTEPEGVNLGTLGIFLVGSVRLMGVLLPIQRGFADVKAWIAQAEMGFQILRERELNNRIGELPELEAENENGRKSDARAPSAVKISNVVYRFPGSDSDFICVDHLQIEQGESVGIIGPSGAGKSTLVDLIVGLRLPTAGSVKLFHSLHDADSSPRAYKVGYVPQRPGLLPGSVLENIALGIPKDAIDHSRLREAIVAAKLNDWVDSLPEGVYSHIGKQGESISGGQIQRLGIARALYRSPSLLILDESTSALDPGTESEVTDTIAELPDNVTTLVIAHRLSTVKELERILFLENGKIIADGSFSHVRKKVSFVERYIGLTTIDPA